MKWSLQDAYGARRPLNGIIIVMCLITLCYGSLLSTHFPRRINWRASGRADKLNDDRKMPEEDVGDMLRLQSFHDAHRGSANGQDE